MNPSTIVDRIQWHEGMLLGPQHFQQAVLRTEQLLAYTLHTAQAFSWGVRYFNLDASSLLDGQLRINDLEAIMPDGLLVTINPAQDDELWFDLEPYLESLKSEPLTVYLCVPAYHPELSSHTRYYSVEGQAVTDYNTGNNSLNIPRLKPRLSLMAGEQPPSRFTYFPLLQLTLRSENIVQTDFIPPLLEIGTRSALHEWLSDIGVQMREKATVLSQQLRSPAHAVRGHKPALYDTRTVLQGLVNSLPALEALLRVGVAHPYSTYLLTCHLAGQLAAFVGAVVPPVFPAYQHNQLRQSFTPVCHFIQDMLDTIHESYQIIVFHYQDGQFSLLAEPEWLEHYLVIGLKARSTGNENDLQQWGEACLIGGQSHLDSMLARRVLGATRKRIDKDDSMDLIAPKDMVLLRVEVDPAFIQAGEPLVILNPQQHSIAPEEILFYLRR